MKQLIDKLITEGYLKTPRIIEAFQCIDRVNFLPSAGKGAQQLFAESELDAPRPTYFDQTISQPLTVAVMLELLQPMAGEQVLDIGSGSGWTAALLSFLVGRRGKVTSVERIAELKNFAEINVAKYQLNNVDFILGNGWMGYKKNAPYDRIHVAAAASEMPEELISQLKNGGRMVIPIGRVGQDLVLVRKGKDGRITENRHPGYVFVPLVDD